MQAFTRPIVQADLPMFAPKMQNFATWASIVIAKQPIAPNRTFRAAIEPAAISGLVLRSQLGYGARAGVEQIGVSTAAETGSRRSAPVVRERL
jgi:hypothetical protein